MQKELSVIFCYLIYLYRQIIWTELFIFITSTICAHNLISWFISNVWDTCNTKKNIILSVRLFSYWRILLCLFIRGIIDPYRRHRGRWRVFRWSLRGSNSPKDTLRGLTISGKVSVFSCRSSFSVVSLSESSIISSRYSCVLLHTTARHACTI